jgi:hypothetical protein
MPDRRQHAKLVAFRICHNHPGDILLTDVNPNSPEFLKPLNLDLLIVRAQVQVESVFSPLLFAAGHQCKPCRPLCVNEEVPARRARPDVFEIECRPPKRTHPTEVVAIKQDTIDSEAHDPPHSSRVGSRPSMPDTSDLLPLAFAGRSGITLWRRPARHRSSPLSVLVVGLSAALIRTERLRA